MIYAVAFLLSFSSFVFSIKIFLLQRHCLKQTKKLSEEVKKIREVLDSDSHEVDLNRRLEQLQSMRFSPLGNSTIRRIK